MKDYTKRLFRGEKLSDLDAYRLVEILLTDIDEASFFSTIGALEGRGVMVNELVGFIKYFKDKAQKPSEYIINEAKNAYEITATGSEVVNSFDVIFATNLLLAAAGYKVIKHGNGNDLLKFLNINPESLNQEKTDEMLKQTNFTYLCSSYYNPYLEKLNSKISVLDTRTVFDILKPLLNPANPAFLLAGAYSYHAAELMSRVSVRLSLFERAMFVSSSDFLDNVSISAPTRSFLIDKLGFKGQSFIKPSDFGLPVFTDELKINSKDDEDRIFNDLLDTDSQKPICQAIILNATIALSYGLKEYDSHRFNSFKQVIEDGKLKELIQKLRSF